MYLAAAKERIPLTPLRRKPVRTTRINCPIQVGRNFPAEDSDLSDLFCWQASPGPNSSCFCGGTNACVVHPDLGRSVGASDVQAKGTWRACLSYLAFVTILSAPEVRSGRVWIIVRSIMFHKYYDWSFSFSRSSVCGFVLRKHISTDRKLSLSLLSSIWA